MIKIKLFGSIRETLQLDSTQIQAEGISSVRDVWQAIASDQPVDDNLYCSVNHHHSSFETAVSDGDEVAFFPPVTGG